MGYDVGRIIWTADTTPACLRKASGVSVPTSLSHVLLEDMTGSKQVRGSLHAVGVKESQDSWNVERVQAFISEILRHTSPPSFSSNAHTAIEQYTFQPLSVQSGFEELQTMSSSIVSCSADVVNIATSSSTGLYVGEGPSDFESALQKAS